MKALSKILFALIVCAAVFACTRTASAQYGNYGRSGGFGGCAPWNQIYGGAYFGVNRPILPYFSLHPPVYYSHVVPRPYGYSPFALPPGVLPAEAFALPKQGKVKEIVNPFYRSDAPREETHEGKTASRVRVIVNPYYKPSEPAADAQPAWIAGHSPDS